MMYLIALFLLPYLCFVFFGEGFNPFVKPRLHTKRTRWRHGRVMAIAAFLGVLSVFVISLTLESMSVLAVIVGILVALTAAATLSTRKISNFFWGH